MKVELRRFNTQVVLCDEPWERGIHRISVNNCEIPFLLPAFSAHHFFTGIWPPPPGSIDYEPHESYGALQQITNRAASWHQPATAYSRVESRVEYQLVGPGSLELQIETSAHATAYPFGYVGLFWGMIAPPGGQRGFHTIVADDKGELHWHYFCGHGDNLAPSKNTILGPQMNSPIHSPTHPPTYFFAESQRRFALPIQVARWHNLYYCLEVDTSDIAFADVLMGTAIGGPSWDLYWCLQPGQVKRIVCRLTVGIWPGWEVVEESYRCWQGCVAPSWQIKPLGHNVQQALVIPAQPQVAPEGGLALAQQLYELRGKRLLEELNLLSVCSVGCFGGTSQNATCDDAVSRDHMWGPYLTFLLPAQHWSQHHERLEEAVRTMPDEAQGFQWVGYNGPTPRKTKVYEIDVFLQELTGFVHRPQTDQEWLPYLMKTSWLGRRWLERLFDAGQGQVFHDPGKQYIQLHRHWTAFVPPNIHKALLARSLFRVWNAGPEYNLKRLAIRGDQVAFHLGVNWFINEVMELSFYWNEQYIPSYKWRLEHFHRLPICPTVIAHGIDTLGNTLDIDLCLDTATAIVKSVKRLMKDLYHLSPSVATPLFTFAQAVHAQIEDEQVKEYTVLEW